MTERVCAEPDCGVSLAGEHHNRKRCRPCAEAARELATREGGRRHDLKRRQTPEQRAARSARRRERGETKRTYQSPVTLAPRFCLEPDCGVSLDGEHPMRQRCEPCAREHKRAKERADQSTYGKSSRGREVAKSAHANYRAKPDTRKKELEYLRQWRELNLEHARAWQRWYYTETPTGQAARRKGNRTRKARQRGATIHPIPTEALEQIRARPCLACGKAGPSTIEHLIPIARGGPHALENLDALCGPCNSSKGKLTLDEWIASDRPLAPTHLRKRAA